MKPRTLLAATSAPEHIPTPWKYISTQGDHRTRVDTMGVECITTANGVPTGAAVSVTIANFPSFATGEERSYLVDLDTANANLKFALRACNNHYSLLKACKSALVALKGREHDQFLRDAISHAEAP